MATADQVAALIRSHFDRDDARFRAVSLQVVAHAEQHGHGKIAQELRRIVDRSKDPPRADSVPLPAELAPLMDASRPSVGLVALSLDGAIEGRLRGVLREHAARDRLRAFGLEPARKVLMVGPPGTGKTSTTSALAAELGMPLYAVRLDGVIKSHLGETAEKLRIVFDAVRRFPGLYFFDEVDALGADRGAKDDVGEMRRVMASFLQFLDLDTSDSLVVAATNYPELLDRALRRRFDVVVEYVLPTPAVVEAVMRRRLGRVRSDDVDWTRVRAAAAGRSHADVAGAAERAAKCAVLEGVEAVSTDMVLAELEAAVCA